MERVDVAVVGGGPAGTSAARTAAEAGADVLVLERGVPREDRGEPGPDSTDAGGFLDYWVDLAGLDHTAIPDDVVHRRLRGAEFVGPTERLDFSGRTGMGGGYPHFGFTFHRARFDDWLRRRAERAGARFRVGTAVQAVDPRGADAGSGGVGPTSGAGTGTGEAPHRIELADGSELAADRVVLADGPQRSVTLPVLEALTPDDLSVADRLGPRSANHLAYQEYRRFPADCFDPERIRFWWGWMPGHTAYPWVFPNDGRVARVGFTRPLDLDLADVDDPGAYRLLDGDDDRIPDGETYVRRLLAAAYPDRDPDEFPRVEGRGKSGGTETYPISSTRPVESPVDAGIAVAGGAMGGTSAFHEGGDHVAIRTGTLAGRLAAEGRLAEYNDAWRAALDDELARNAAMAALVRGFGPAEWDRAFGAVSRARAAGEGRPAPVRTLSTLRAAGRTGVSLYLSYRRHRRRLRDGGYLQVRADEYGSA